MKDKSKLVKWYFCSLNDLGSIQAYLEEMALKGWMLEEIRSMRLIFRRYKPDRVFYSVQAFDKSSTSDSGRTTANHEFVESCEAKGWHFVSSKGKIHVFCAFEENTVPVYTDTETELKFISKSMLKQKWFYIPWTLILLFSFFTFFINNDLSFYTDPDSVTEVCLWAFMAILFLSQIIDHIFWHISAKRAIAKGKKIPLQSGQTIIFVLTFSAIIWAAFVLVSIISENYLFLISIAVILGIVLALVMINLKIKKLVKTKMSGLVFPLLVSLMVCVLLIVQLSWGLAGLFGAGHQGAHTISYRAGDGGVTFTSVYNDPLPLTLQDLSITANETYSRERDDMGRFLAQETDYSDSSPVDSNAPSINYSVYTTKYRWVYNKITDYYLSGKAPEYLRFPNRRAINIDGADKIYASVVSDNDNSSDYNYLVLYDDKIAFFQSSFEMNNGQIAKCVEKLK